LGTEALIEHCYGVKDTQIISRESIEETLKVRYMHRELVNRNVAFSPFT
jgi:hypothetical protein